MYVVIPTKQKNFLEAAAVLENFPDVLKKCPLFYGAEDSELERIIKLAETRIIVVKKNQIILSEGEPAELLGIVLSGAVRIVREDYYGNRSILAELSPADIFAESFVCTGTARLPVSAVAAEDGSVMLLNGKKILGNSRTAGNLLKITAEKNLILNRKIDIISKRTIREKIMTYLMYMAKENGSAEFTVPYDRQALADYLETERSALSAEISRLRREGVIECERSRFRLLDAENFRNNKQ